MKRLLARTPIASRSSGVPTLDELCARRVQPADQVGQLGIARVSDLGNPQVPDQRVVEH